MITVLLLLFIFSFGRVTVIADHNNGESSEESEEQPITNDSTTTTNDGMTTINNVHYDDDLQGMILKVEDESGTPYDAGFSINDTCWQQENGRKDLKIEVQHVNQTECNLIFKLTIKDCHFECKIPNTKNCTKLKRQFVVKSSPRLYSCFNGLHTTTGYSQENVDLPLCQSPRQSNITNISTIDPCNIPLQQPNIINTTTSSTIMPSPQSTTHGATGTEGTVVLVVGILVIVSTVVLTVVIMYLVWQRRGSGLPSRTRFDSQTVQPHLRSQVTENTCNTSTLAHRGSQHSTTNSLYESFSNATNPK